MYNEKYKEEYLSQKDIAESTKLRYRITFAKTEPFEFAKNKDLFDMSFEELEIIFYRAKYRKTSTLVNHVSRIVDYINWAKLNGFSETRDNPIVSKVNPDFVDKYLYKTANNYYTKEEIYDGMDELLNVQHKAILLCFFEGIKGNKTSEIRNLKYEDLTERDGQYFAHVLSDEETLANRTVQISEKLYSLLIEAYSLSEIIGKSGRKNRVADGEFIFRRNRTAENEVKLSNATVGSTVWVQFIKGAFDDKKITSIVVRNSGIMHRTNELMNLSGARVLTKTIANQVIDEYDLSSQIINGTNYSSYSAYKNIINVDYMQEVYGDFKMDI